MNDLREHIQVVLLRPRFPENIGMCARACANMGISRLVLVEPELWTGQKDDAKNCMSVQYREKALALATCAGREVIANLRICPSLPDALAASTLSIGATARTGGWRQGILNPAQAAELIISHLRDGGGGGEKNSGPSACASLVFGPEDKGLDNAAIERCSHLVTISTAGEPSLNLAQAVLVMLYELSRALPFERAEQPPRPGRVRYSPPINLEQQELLIARLKEAMLALGSLPADNSSYFMLPIRRLVSRSQIRHNEFSMLMGICNKILRLAALAASAPNGGASEL